LISYSNSSNTQKQLEKSIKEGKNQTPYLWPVPVPVPLSMTKVETTETPCEIISWSGIAHKEERVSTLRRVRYRSSPFLTILSGVEILILRVFRGSRKMTNLYFDLF